MRRMITNPELLEAIRFLKVKARENKVGIWAVAADRLSASRQRRPLLNLNHISRASKANSLVFVPGKVLGAGYLDHPVVVGAFEFSQSAKQKIESAGGRCLPITEFVAQHPKGSNVQIMR